MVNVYESGMIFGPFCKDDFFAIENVVQEGKLSGDGVCSVEFLVKQDSSLIFLEAKSSIPRETEDFFNEITKKFSHSLILFVNSLLERNRLQCHLPSGLRNDKCFLLKIKLLLVVRGVPDSYLMLLTDKLRSSLKALAKLWSVAPSDILVINEGRAIKYKLATKINND